ncbi:MAG TPA: pyridoxal-phosphate dependent enzyme [Woeseiaceae bacterium]|nr:pyridoxal-phosphate dependent enzyme [Woeseiaceae bacterium]
MSHRPQLATLASTRALVGGLLGKEKLADLPTPVREYSLRLPAGERKLTVKLDNLTGGLYGGNKVRKLEYILYRARQKHCERIATFGTVASHHALATAIYANQLGLPCTCFLSHQAPTPATSDTLRLHVQIGTSLVRYGGAYQKRLEILRENLWGQHPWVVPIGGSSWLGTFGFVCAGIELAEQVAAGLLPVPDRLYVAAGTMGTAAGLALGLAMANLETEVHAVRVSDTSICNEDALLRLLDKTARMMRRLDQSLPCNLVQRVNVRVRHEFFAGGYARSDAATDAAIDFARDQLDLELEGTYTGKAMAAVIRDFDTVTDAGKHVLFWNTFSSTPLPLDHDAPFDRGALPGEFLRYLVH